ncbi:hypothetical protein PHJA_002459800 [Phtheirospermum japonicum]|uniref:Pre-rRNA-processing protein RIX1 N-terminal domain-containing protein n=1 Tax=Phtheirospermum japonicum TaxID=374723 RepID=A0A830CVY7_9LAMI|nr:hypothetical protein PHJA_002459800 [Phtheirospermum japonicum]
MAASEGMYNVALKPKLLRSLLREYVPDERHPFSNPSELSYVVSTVKNHKLLSEWAPQPVEQDLVEAWKSAVDSWVNRLLTLASSNLSPEVSNFVKAASCASLSDMFTRLSGFSIAKKDGTSKATIVIQPALKLLNEDTFVLEEAICLLCTMINYFPLSVHRHHDSVEAAIILKIMSGKCCGTVLKKLAYGLSLLPKSRGDEDSWSLMMDKILIHINSQLNDAFQGLEEEAKSTQTMRALVPSGKEPPLPLGGLAMSERTSDFSTRRPERLLGSGVSTLMQCCCDMLTISYPVMVPVPVCGLIALAVRVLMVDVSLSLSSYSFMTTLKQEFICSEIPLLQLHSLEILAAVVKILSSQLLPHAAGIVQVLKEYLRTCKFPDLKIKAYSILKVLLLSMGTGTAIHISQDIVINVSIDLDFLGGEKDGKSAGTQTNAHQGLLSNSHQRKRKHSFMVRSSQEQPAHDHSDVGNPHSSTPTSLKIAALEALEALLTMGGSMRSESWRGNVDHLLITVATKAFKGGWSREEKKVFFSGDPMPKWADFQLAALRALLASLLSPGQTRPSHFALGLELFHRGMQETGTKLGEYCGHALLALEVLIHPRALPLLDSSADEYKVLSHKSRDVIYPSGDRQISIFQAGTIGKGPGEPESIDDDLNENWLGNDDETKIQITDRQKPPASGPNDKSMADTYEKMSESLGYRNTMNQRTAADDGDVGARSGAGALESVELEPVSGRVALVDNDVTVKSDVISEVCKGSASTSGEQESEKKNDECATIVERISAMFESDNERSDDSLPDIVDGDPDSD